MQLSKNQHLRKNYRGEGRPRKGTIKVGSRSQTASTTLPACERAVAGQEFATQRGLCLRGDVGPEVACNEHLGKKGGGVPAPFFDDDSRLAA